MRLLLAAAALLASGCPHGGPGPAPPGRSAPRSLVLHTDAVLVDRVEVVGELPGSPRSMTRTGPGRWALRLTRLKPGRLYRYRFRIHRRDLGRWLEVSDPTAWLWDASRRRDALLEGGAGLAPRGARVPLKPPSLRDLVIYEICPREIVEPRTPFAHPSRAPDARGPGRVLRRITDRIRSGYFNRLGVNAIELMPLMATAWTRHGRHTLERDPWGYLPLSWYALNGDLGSPADLAQLVREAHRRGLTVLVDLSLDHGYGGDRHGLLTDLQPTWRRSDARNRWGLLEMELSRPDVRRFLVGALRRLLVDYDVDGFRMDWTEKVPWRTWARITRAIREIKPTAVLITENPVVDHVARAGFDGAWDFFFHHEAPLLLRQVYHNHDGHTGKRVSTQDKLVENLTSWAKGPDAPPGPLVRYIESHDLPRIARERVRWQHGGDALVDIDGDGKTPDWVSGGGRSASRLGATLLFTVPGTPMLFAGQEHGAADDLAWGFDPLDWSRVDRALLRHYSRMIALRLRTPALRSDDLRVLLNDTARHLLVYSRGIDPERDDDDSVIVALSFGSKTQRLRLPLPSGTWRDLLAGGRHRGEAVLVLPGRGAALLSRSGDPVVPSPGAR